MGALEDIKIKLEDTGEPKPDLCTCSECRWTGPITECEVDPEGEGDWESGYYPVDLCPKCEDGGCIDDYSMSEERAREWKKWEAKRPY